MRKTYITPGVGDVLVTDLVVRTGLASMVAASDSINSITCFMLLDSEFDVK